MDYFKLSFFLWQQLMFRRMPADPHWGDQVSLACEVEDFYDTLNGTEPEYCAWDRMILKTMESIDLQGRF